MLVGIVLKFLVKFGGSCYVIWFVQYICVGCCLIISLDVILRLMLCKILLVNGKVFEWVVIQIVESYREEYYVLYLKNLQKMIKCLWFFWGEWVLCYWKLELEQIVREWVGYINYCNVVLYVFE